MRTRGGSHGDSDRYFRLSRSQHLAVHVRQGATEGTLYLDYDWKVLVELCLARAVLLGRNIIDHSRRSGYTQCRVLFTPL
jgi:hypothetical protein